METDKKPSSAPPEGCAISDCLFFLMEAPTLDTVTKSQKQLNIFRNQIALHTTSKKHKNAKYFQTLFELKQFQFLERSLLASNDLQASIRKHSCRRLQL